jgi:REP element-mobilizing transposase RayT
MAVKKLQEETDGTYFCTFTCHNWIPLIEMTGLYDHIYNWFDFMKKKFGNQVLGYVVMPNHIHFLIYLSERSISINKLISNGKRFMAYEIVKRLKEQNSHQILAELNASVDFNEAKKGKRHQIFEQSFDCKKCFTKKFIMQKIKYIHQNPLRGKWNLAETVIDYPHSSARFYETGEHSTYQVTSYNDLR